MSVIYDQLKVSADGSSLTVGAHVSAEDITKGVLIDSLTIIPADLKNEICHNPNDKDSDGKGMEVYKLTFKNEETFEYKDAKGKVYGKVKITNASTERQVVIFSYDNTADAPYFTYIPGTGNTPNTLKVYTVRSSVDYEGATLSAVVEELNDIIEKEDVSINQYVKFTCVEDGSVEGFADENYTILDTILQDNTSFSLTLTKQDFDNAFNSESLPDPSGATASKPFTEADFNSSLFFIYVHTAESLNSSTPCSSNHLGIAFNAYLYYKKAMNFTKELINDCSEHRGFTDFILLWNAFKAALITGNFLQGIRIFKALFLEGSSVISASKCGCHG